MTVENGTDVDTLKTTNTYKIFSDDNLANLPESGVGGTLEIFSSDSETTVQQFFHVSDKTRPRTYMRAYYSNAWGNWQRIYGNIGINPIASTDEDTTANWAALGSGYAYFNAICLNSQPTTYGFVENIVSGTLVYQTFYSMNGNSPVWHRSGDANGWYSGSANWVNEGLMAYPVGAVYISYNSTSPAELFGGTWTAITGVFPYFNAGTGVGGSNTHTLTVAQMPSHNHSFTVRATSGTAAAWRIDFQNVQGQTTSTNYTGGSGSHNNMPAYQTFYAWRRTA